MNHLLEHLKTEKTGRRYLGKKPFTVDSITEKDEDSARPTGFGVSYEYRISTTIAVTFRANDVQYNNARANAMRLFNEELYRDFRTPLLLAQTALFNDDKEEALVQIREIQAIIKDLK